MDGEQGFPLFPRSTEGRLGSFRREPQREMAKECVNVDFCPEPSVESTSIEIYTCVAQCLNGACTSLIPLKNQGNTKEVAKASNRQILTLDSKPNETL